MTDSMPDNLPQPAPKKKIRWVTPLIYDVLLVFILFIGAFFRFIGIQWGDYQYLHPDERFLISVGADMQLISAPPEALGTPPNTVNNPWRVSPTYTYPDCKDWGGYFDASCSPLNPNNRGHSFYVYGTLPMFVTRYVVQWIYGHTGYNEMTDVGRVLSAFIDLLSVILVYAIGSRAFKKPVGLLAAAFAAFTVLNIQQSHFFTMDTFSNFFTLLAIYYAVRVSLVKDKPETALADSVDNPEVASTGEDESGQSQTNPSRLVALIKHPYFALSIAFGVALGMAVSSKLNSAPVAFVLPVAFGVIIWRRPPQERSRWLMNAMLYLGTAAFVSILVFRILQPYAFLGPGFFGVRPNPQWVANIKEQRSQAAGDIDFPPSLQWARRPIWFSAQNMVEWGLGIPLGVLAFAGFLWAGWRMLKGDWPRHVVLWLWGGFYFVWQSTMFNPTMRYQMPTYPILAIYAAWGLAELWNLRSRKSKPRSEQGNDQEKEPHSSPVRWARPAALIAGSLVLITTFAWALAFSLIYARPITRVAASDWIYQNIPGPINLPIQTADGSDNQLLPVPYGSTIQPGLPYTTSFTAHTSGTLNEVYLAHAADTSGAHPAILLMSLSTATGSGQPLATSILTVTPALPGASSNQAKTLNIDPPVSVEAGQAYTLELAFSEQDRLLDLCGPLQLTLQTSVQLITQTIPGPNPCQLRSDSPYSITFTPQESGILQAITLSRLVDQTPVSGSQTLVLSITPPGDNQVGAAASLTANLTPGPTGLGAGYMMTLDRPLTLDQGQSYILSIALTSGSGVVTVSGSAVANEGDWDDGLPLRVGGYDAFSGIYQPGLNFNMYTDDNPDKLEHFIDVYDQSEYLFISSNRQWGSLPRIPERFPMSSLHYRHLLGCPDDKTIAWCYSVAQPGMFQGDLGFELVAVFQSDPSLGPLRINDQFAEEAFTVYEHPKVLVFRKTEAYSSSHDRQVLSQANFSEIVKVTPKKAAYHPANIELPEVSEAAQTAGGTWSELFNPQALQNRYQVVGVILWYLSVSLLGLLVYPLLRIALPGLHDHGYPIARIAGMLILAYLTWMAGSVNIPFSRLTISIVILIMAAVGAYLAYRQRDALLQEFRDNRKYFMIVEGLVLAFFLVFLFIRLGNPDLWHPYKGGEKPMDFSYFNAVLKSTTFPPYDPWHAGGYMNYYYWGYVFVGVLVKWLGIVPAFAYNLILPTLFSMIGMGAFCIGYNLSHLGRKNGERQKDDPPLEAEQLPANEQQYPPAEERAPPASTNRPYLIGIASALGMVVLGNLGTLRMILKGWESLGVPGGLTDSTGFFTRLAGLPVGLWNALFHGAQMPYALADWYWLPSRAIPAPGGDILPITEFPMFTFLYADMHAHMIAMVIAMLALTWAVAVLLGKARWQSVGAGAASIILGGLAIGALYPTNLSDIYTYLPIGMLVLGYALFRYGNVRALYLVPQNLVHAKTPGFSRVGDAAAGGGRLWLVPAVPAVVCPAL